MSAAVTIRSLAAQTMRDFEWWVALHPDDELLEERQHAFQKAGVPMVWRMLRPVAYNRPRQALAAYKTLGPFTRPTLSTRLDDDDAFTADAFTRLREVVTEDGECAYLFPAGHRVWGGRYTEVRHESNAMSSLFSPRGRSVVSYLHRQVRSKVQRVRFVDDQPGWLWVRHDDNLDKWQEAYHPITDDLRALYPIDWTILDRQPLMPAKPPRQGTGDLLV